MPKPNYLEAKNAGRRSLPEASCFASDTPKTDDFGDSDVMTAEEAAIFLRTSRPSLIQSVKRGEVPCLKIGTTYRFSRTALRDAMREKNHVDL